VAFGLQIPDINDQALVVLSVQVAGFGAALWRVAGRSTAFLDWNWSG